MWSKTESSIIQRILHKIKYPTDQRLVTNLFILVSGDMLGRAVAAIAFVHLARVFEPRIYGQLELSLAIVVFLIVVVDQGLTPLGSREVARHQDDEKALTRTVISSQLFVAIFLCIIIPIVLLVLPIDNTIKYLVGGYTISLLGYPFILNWVFLGRNQMIWVAIPQLFRQLTFSLIVLAIIWRPEQIFQMPVIELISVIIAVALNVFLFFKTGGHISIGVRGVFQRDLYIESLPIAGSQIIWALRMYLPTILLGILAGQLAVGYFSAPQRIVMVAQAIMIVYFTNLFPHMSKISIDSESKLVRVIERSVQIVFWPLLLVAIITTFTSPWIMSTFFGSAYAHPESTNTLAILIWILPIFAFRGNARNAMVVISRQKEELICSLVGIILLVGLSIPFITYLDAPGSALAVVISEATAALLMFWRLKIHLSNLSIKNSLLWRGGLPLHWPSFSPKKK